MSKPARAVSEAETPAKESVPPASFEAFFESEHRRLLRALYLVTGNAQEAEEIVQETFVAAWDRWDRVGTMERPTGYLYRTAMNRFRSRLRRAARAARRLAGAAERGDAFAAADERDALARALTANITRTGEFLGLPGIGDVSEERIVGPLPPGCAEVRTGAELLRVDRGRAS